MATARIGRLFSSVRRPPVPPNRLTSPASQVNPERIPAHCSRTERGVAWWLTCRRDERPRGMITFAGGTTLLLAIERRLRDNHVMRRQARGAPGSYRGIYQSDL